MRQHKMDWKANLIKLSWKDSLITIAILAIASCCCYLIQKCFQTDDYVRSLFLIAVVFVSRFTDSYFYGMLSSVIAVFGVNYAFTYPYFQLNFSLRGYPLTFFVLFSVSLVISMLTTRIKQQEKINMEIEKEQMRANLLRAVSHDIRTPLTSIVGAVSAVIENYDKLSEEKALVLLGDVKEEAQWLVRVVNNLLLVTRIDSDSAKVSKEPEMVEEVLSEAVARIKNRFPDAPVKTKMPEDVLFVPMDAMLIEQVLCNLMENAVVHGGNVSEILVTVKKEAGNVVFSVADDGAGIDSEKLPRILNERICKEIEADSDRKRNMGIGLAVCKSIICAHGGSTTAYNRAEGGAVFEFTLPVKEG